MENNNTAIIAKDYRLSDILSNKKYTVDYFQREYKWETIHIEQLVFAIRGGGDSQGRRGCAAPWEGAAWRNACVFRPQETGLVKGG